VSARDWRAAEASLQVPAFARFVERSQPASQLARFGVSVARFGVIHAKGRRRSGDRDVFERSQPASQLARFGVSVARFGVSVARFRVRVACLTLDA
jgi:predicted alpha/beta-hydrolase family hydrolase